MRENVGIEKYKIMSETQLSFDNDSVQGQQHIPVQSPFMILYYFFADDSSNIIKTKMQVNLQASFP